MKLFVMSQRTIKHIRKKEIKEEGKKKESRDSAKKPRERERKGE